MAVIISYFLILNSCNSTEPPPPPVIEPTDTVTVSITDKTHRSITINVKTTLNNRDWKIELFREKQAEEDTLLADFSVETEDTTIIDDNGGKGLELETEYGYYTILSTETGEIKDKSEKVIGRTLGATSHNYVWEEYTIGESGVLYDVWGTDENNVYAVGAFDIGDTTYGLAHWNGTNWTPIDDPGGLAIYGFGENDIWVAGGKVFHFNGTQWLDIDRGDQVLSDNVVYTCLWGTSSENLYFGNQGGKIVHWDGRRGSVVKEFLTTSITDINGYNKDNFWIVGRKNMTGGDDLVVQYKNGIWEQLIDGALMSQYPNSVYPVNDKITFICGNFCFYNFANQWNAVPINISGSYARVRGSNSNNVFSVGNRSEILHYNGKDWNRYEELTTAGLVLLNGLKVFENKVFIVGMNEGLAYLLIGN
ncbi:MAG: hypothetical protein J5I57_06385 [Melioribacteraceae bacterium]|nr:hypothetical protein [Melioribacteraceae bacterium]